MTDRKLLELAAKAAGVFMRKEDWPFSDPFDPKCLETHFDPGERSITGTRVWFGGDGEVCGTELHTWHPLTSDGDALRLAVKLQMRVGVGYVDRVMGQMLDYFEGDDVEPMADTRLAIVRAAAAYAQSLAATSSGDSR